MRHSLRHRSACVGSWGNKVRGTRPGGQSAAPGAYPALLLFATDRAPLDAEHRGSLSFASVPEIFIFTALYHSLFQPFVILMPEIFFWNIQNRALTLHSKTNSKPVICIDPIYNPIDHQLPIGGIRHVCIILLIRHKSHF